MVLVGCAGLYYLFDGYITTGILVLVSLTSTWLVNEQDFRRRYNWAASVVKQRPEFAKVWTEIRYALKT
jgi:hypothetical protein